MTVTDDAMSAAVSRVGILGMARDALANLPKTGEAGFEELVQRLLSAHLGISLRLASSGEQEGRDSGAGKIAAEAKRYGNKRLNLRELAGEAILAKAASPQLELWILATTDAFAQQKVERIEKVAAQAKLAIGVVDWLPVECPRLLVLISQYETVAQRWFDEYAPAAWSLISAALSDIRSQPQTLARVSRELQELGQGLALADTLCSTLQAGVRLALADETGERSKEIFGQRIDFYAKTSGAIERPELDARLRRVLKDAAENSNRVLAVIGPEGVGKTWAIVRHVFESWPQRPMVFIPSSLFQLASAGDWGHSKLLVEAILRTLSIVEDCDLRLKDEQFLGGLLAALSRAKSDRFNPVVILDGFNERNGAHWASAINKLPDLLPLAAQPPIFLTTRASPWPQLGRILQRQKVDYSDFDVFAFSETEFKAACARQNVDASAFDPETAKDLRNPRLFRIAAELLDALAGG